MTYIWINLSEHQCHSLNCVNLKLKFLQINIEDFPLSKLNILEMLISINNSNLAFFQETHKENDAILKLPGFNSQAKPTKKYHCLMAFVKDDIQWVLTESLHKMTKSSRSPTNSRNYPSEHVQATTDLT